jgi:hypothetical protein
MPQRRFPRPWRFEPIPGGYRVIDANGIVLARVYDQSGAIRGEPKSMRVTITGYSLSRIPCREFKKQRFVSSPSLGAAMS